MSDEKIDPEVATMFERIFGAELGEQLCRSLHDESPWFNAVVAKNIAPVVWNRSGMDMRTKVLCAIAIFSAMGKDEAELFMRAALIHGVSVEEIQDLLLLVGLETGFPNASRGARLLTRAQACHQGQKT